MPEVSDLAERVAQLEAQMKGLNQELRWLTEKLRAGESTDPGLTPSPLLAAPTLPTPPPVQAAGVPRPLPHPPNRSTPRAPSPRTPMNPVVWVAGAGALLFLAGAAFFLHWSIQRGWLGPELRFLLGLLGGGAITALAARYLLRERAALGTSLLLAGLGTLVFAFRMGAFTYHFFPPTLGFAASFLLVLVAGGLAARAKCGGALAVGLGTGLLAPIVFSQGGHHEVALALYLTVLMGAALAVAYLGKVSARWAFSRWLALAGTWLLLTAACFEIQAGDALALLGLLVVHLALAGLWIWLPGQEEAARPVSPTTLWVLVVLSFTGLLWQLWKHDLHWMPEAFALPILCLAGLNLALVKPLRARLGNRQADFGLLALAAGFLALAVPVALAWRWVGPLWGAFALGMTWAAGRVAGHPDWDEAEAATLRRLALGLLVAGTLRWMVHGGDVWDFGYAFGDWRPLAVPFLNTRFVEGALVALGWGLLARNGAFPILGALGLEFVGGVTLGVELAHLVRYSGGTLRSASIVLTLTWALLGAGQWLKGLGTTGGLRRMLMAGGYGWLGVASAKLILVDLATADTPLRALAFLGVGGIFMGAALLGNHLRPETRA